MSPEDAPVNSNINRDGTGALELPDLASDVGNSWLAHGLVSTGR